jgi:ribonuclease Z
MDFTLKIMGSGSAMPVTDRNQSAQVLVVHGRSFLIDCGEGTQRQMVRSGVSPMKIDSIFISHIHGDHVFGLFGLLSTMGMKARTTPLNVYGPNAVGPLLKFFQSFYGDGLSFELRFIPVSAKEPEVIMETKTMEVLAFPLNHGIECYGYMFREKEPLMDIRKEAVAEYGFTRAEIGALKRGEDILRPAGPDEGATFMNGFVRHSGISEDLLIRNSDVAYKPFEPRSYAYCSDTAPFPEEASWVKGVDLLYHETTYLDSLKDQAEKRHHSTTLQAAALAEEAGVGKLVIGHYSSRSGNPEEYERECRTIFPETYAAEDGFVFEV